MAGERFDPQPKDIFRTKPAITEVLGSEGSAPKLTKTIPTPHNSPASKQISAVPRHTVPAQPENKILKPSDELHSQSKEDETASRQVETPIPEAAPDRFAKAKGKKVGVPPGVTSKPIQAPEPSPPVKSEPLQPPKDSNLVTERSTPITQKPKQDYPLPSLPNEAKRHTPAPKSSKPVVDAEGSVGQGTLPEPRVVVLEGKDGSRPVDPPTKPTTNNPSRKSSPKPFNPSLSTEEKPPASFETVVRPPLVGNELKKTLAKEEMESAEHDTIDQVKKEPEEDERRRYTALNDHAQRLDGPRVEMGPPVIAPKLPVGQLGVLKPEGAKRGTDHIKWRDGAVPIINSTEATPPPTAGDPPRESGGLQPGGTLFNGLRLTHH